MRRIPKPLAITIALVLALQLLPVRSLAEAAADVADDAAETVAAEEVEEVDATDAATPEGEPELSAAAEESEAEPALEPQDEIIGDVKIRVGDRLQYKDEANGYWYWYEVLTTDGFTTGTVRINSIRYIDSRGSWGNSSDLPEGVEAASEDYAYPSEVGANVTDNGADSNFPDVTFTVTSLGSLGDLPSWRSVHIPATVTELAGRAYLGENVATVTFDPACQITAIPAHFLESHKQPLTIELPDTVETIGDQAFQFTNLTSFTMPASLRSIGEKAFYHCTALRSVTFNEGLETVGNNAFDTTMLEEINLPQSLRAIGDYAFYKASGYLNGDNPDAANYSEAFQFDTVVIPNNVTSIGEHAFTRDVDTYNGDLTEIASVTLGESVETIGMNAFAGASITALELPASLKTLEIEESGWSGPFSYCALLETVTCADIDHSQLETLGGFSDCAALSSFEVPSSVTAIAPRAFSGCTALESIEIPPTVSSIGEYAFGNAGLKRVAIPSSVKAIGDSAFASCESLAKVTLSEGLETIGAAAFLRTPALTSITIPASVSTIGVGAFRAGEYYRGSYTSTYQHTSYGGGLTSLVIKDGETPLTIAESAFESCEGLSGSKIVLPERVSALAGGAFLGIADATFEIYNPALALVEGKSGAIYEAYDVPAAEAASLIEHVNYYHDEDEGTYDLYIPDPWASNDSSFNNPLPRPNGSVVRYPSTLTAETSPTFAAFLKYFGPETQTNNQVHPTFEAFDAGEGPDNPGPGDDDPVEVAAAGRLLVTTTGAAAAGANVNVFDADGNLVSRGQAYKSYAVIDGLEPGTYTVAAFAKNDSFSSVGRLSAFATLGLTSSDYVTQSGVEIAADEDTEITLNVPTMSEPAMRDAVKSSSVAIAKKSVYPDMEFFATINYVMDSWSTAGELTVTLPRGVVPTSVTSANKNYGLGGYDEATRTLTVTIDRADQQSARIYLGLKATAGGSLSINAMLGGDFGAAVRIGSASTYCNTLTLDVPTDPVEGREFDVTVNAAPRTDVTLQASGITQTVTTNAVGRATATFDLSEVETTLTYTAVLATVGDGDGAATASGIVEFATTETEPYKLQDFSFVHAKTKYYIVQDGRPRPSRSWYTYIANGQEENKYWTFEASYITTGPLQDLQHSAFDVLPGYTCNLRVQMLDGSSRYQRMSLLSSEKKDDGTYLNTFACSLFLDQAGDHVFQTSLVPCAFDVTLTTPFAQVEPTEADKQALIDFTTGPTFLDWHTKLLVRAKDKIKESTSQTDDELEWLGNEDISWVLFYHVREEWIWEYYEQELPAEDFAQLESYVDAAESLARTIGSIYDAIIGASTPMTECDDVTDWIATNIDYADDIPFDATQLEGQGFNVTSGTASTAEGVGTPLSGLAEPSFGEPTQVATKPTKGPDGSVQSVEYRDSNGNKATFPVGKALDNAFGGDGKGGDFDWLGASDMLALSTIPKDSAVSFLTGIDDAINSKLPQADIDAGRVSKLGKYAGYLGEGANAASVAINQRQRIKESEELGNYYSDAAEARGKADNLTIRLNNMIRKGDIKSDCYKALKNERDWAIIVADGKKTTCDWKVFDFWRSESMDVLGATTGPMTGGAGTAACYGADKMTGKAVVNEMDANNRVLNPALRNLNAAHNQRLEDCDEEEEDAPNPMTPILDPSGTVYEAFPANKLEGVTATVYEVGDDDALTPWLAEDYDQVNPQVTGDNGIFGWDVTRGKWQVKFEKDGFEPAQTDTMEVPPPRTGLDIGMVAIAGPQVVDVTADTKSVEVVFDQWMNADTVYATTINGNGVDYEKIEWVDPVESEEYVAAEDATYLHHFSKVLHIAVPAGTKVGDKLSIRMDGARNYAGKELGEVTFPDVEVKARPTTIEFNFADTISLQAGTARPTTVRVYDGEGKPMEGLALTASLDSDLFATVDATGAVTDADGAAKLQLTAVLPGMCKLTVGVEGTTLERTIALLTTVDANQVARPTATVGKTTIGAGAPAENAATVNVGDKLTLACATEGAKIYYTADGSCPCQNTASRKEYTGPITIQGNMKLIIAGYKDGMDYSEKLHISITAKPVVKKVTKIAITGISKKIAAGKKVKLAAEVTPADAANKAVTWTSSNTKVAKVNASGTVTMVKGGKGKSVTITATAKDGSGVKATYKIKSMKGVVKRVKVSGAASVKAGKSIKLKAGVTATKGANKKLKWTSSNPDWATVNAKGKVTAKKGAAGKTVKITCMATDGSNKKATKKIKIK